MQAPVESLLRLGRIAGETVENAGARPAIGKNGHGVVPGFAGVDSDRKNELAGDIQLFDEDCALDVARGEIVVIIEADFAISDNFGMGAESAQFGIGFGRGFGGFVRMDADGRDDLWVTVGEANGAIEMWRAIAGADAKNAVDAGLGGDPAASTKAFNDFLNSTGYQFNLNQGLDAAERSKASAGLLNSGSTLKALDSYGTGLADTYGQQYESALAGVAGTGENAVNALTGAGQNYANASNSNSNSAATATINANTAASNGINDSVQRALNAFTALRGGSSYGGGSTYNAFSPGG